MKSENLPETDYKSGNYPVVLEVSCMRLLKLAIVTLILYFCINIEIEKLALMTIILVLVSK